MLVNSCINKFYAMTLLDQEFAAVRVSKELRNIVPKIYLAEPNVTECIWVIGIFISRTLMLVFCVLELTLKMTAVDR